MSYRPKIKKDSTGMLEDMPLDAESLQGKVPGSSAGNIPVIQQDGKLVSAILPSYVDDVVEYASLSNFPATGETGKIYVALDTNYTYRWSGSTYIQIGGGSSEGLTVLEIPSDVTSGTISDVDDIFSKILVRDYYSFTLIYKRNGKIIGKTDQTEFIDGKTYAASRDGNSWTYPITTSGAFTYYNRMGFHLRFYDADGYTLQYEAIVKNNNIYDVYIINADYGPNLKDLYWSYETQSNIYSKPSGGIPKTDLEISIRNGFYQIIQLEGTDYQMIEDDFNKINKLTIVVTTTGQSYYYSSGFVDEDNLQNYIFIALDNIPYLRVMTIIQPESSGSAASIDYETWDLTCPDKQEKLVSGTNIKTINNTSLLGSGDITIQGGVSSVKTLKTNNSGFISPSASESIDGSGTINLHKIAKTGQYDSLLHTPLVSNEVYIEEIGMISNLGSGYRGIRDFSCTIDTSFMNKLCDNFIFTVTVYDRINEEDLFSVNYYVTTRVNGNSISRFVEISDCDTTHLENDFSIYDIGFNSGGEEDFSLMVNNIETSSTWDSSSEGEYAFDIIISYVGYRETQVLGIFSANTDGAIQWDFNNAIISFDNN